MIADSQVPPPGGHPAVLMVRKVPPGTSFIEFLSDHKLASTHFARCELYYYGSGPLIRAQTYITPGSETIGTAKIVWESSSRAAIYLNDVRTWTFEHFEILSDRK